MRDYVLCHECIHRRCIYSDKVLSVTEKALLQTAKEEILYSCGMQFITTGSLSEIVLVREGINCQSPTETQYYSGKKKYEFKGLSHSTLYLFI